MKGYGAGVCPSHFLLLGEPPAWGSFPKVRKRRKNMDTILSIGIIFKNDIRCIERCLKALQPLRDAVPCELVM